MGGHVTGPAEVIADRTTQGEPLVLRLVGNEGVLAEQAAPADQGGLVTLPVAGPGYAMAELRDATGRLHAVTNPVFLS
jgi:hypothetical protein